MQELRRDCAGTVQAMTMPYTKNGYTARLPLDNWTFNPAVMVSDEAMTIPQTIQSNSTREYLICLRNNHNDFHTMQKKQLPLLLAVRAGSPCACSTMTSCYGGGCWHGKGNMKNNGPKIFEILWKCHIFQNQSKNIRNHIINNKHK